MCADGDGYDTCPWMSELQVPLKERNYTPGVYQRSCAGYARQGGRGGGRWCGDGGIVLGAQQQSCLQSMCKMCFEGMIVALSRCMEDPKFSGCAALGSMAGSATPSNLLNNAQRII